MTGGYSMCYILTLMIWSLSSDFSAIAPKWHRHGGSKIIIHSDRVVIYHINFTISWAFHEPSMLHTWGLFMAFLIPLWSFMALSLLQQIKQPYICIYIPIIASCLLIDPPTSGKRLFSIAASIHIYTYVYTHVCIN
jgi:hypothetical protein